MKNGCNYVAPWVMDVLKDLYKCKLSFSEVGGGGQITNTVKRYVALVLLRHTLLTTSSTTTH